jgi:hypothetical protein
MLIYHKLGMKSSRHEDYHIYYIIVFLSKEHRAGHRTNTQYMHVERKKNE